MINLIRTDRKGSQKVARTLLDGYWYDRPLTVEACQEEIDTIDRVINYRIKNALNARRAGLIRPMDMGSLIDDLLQRRRRFSDFAECLLIGAASFNEQERRIFNLFTSRVARAPKSPRFVE